MTPFSSKSRRICPKILPLRLWAGLTPDGNVTQPVELKRQAEPWFHRLEGRFLPGSFLHLPQLVAEPRELLGAQVAR